MATDFDFTSCLATLATVCASAQRLKLPTEHNTADETLTTTTTSENYNDFYTSTGHQVFTSDYTATQQTFASLPLCVSTSQSQMFPPASCVVFPEFPTPPPTPDHSRAHNSMSLTQPTNPLTRNPLAYTKFLQYLDETWPEDPRRRGSAVIRASVYMKIADTLRGQHSGNVRFKHWVKRNEFFLIEKTQPDLDYGACLAVPVTKSRQIAGQTKRKGYKAHTKFGQHSYKLVARLEDFAHIIGNYHNCQKGHHGIRRTYAMIKEDFSYVPRIAVAKFIELCHICSENKHRRKSKQKQTTKGNAGSLGEERNEYSGTSTAMTNEVQESCESSGIVLDTTLCNSQTSLHSR